MKKTLHIALAAAAAALAAAGCAKVGEPDAPEGQEITITASFAEDQPKTTLQDGGTQVLWESGDEIKVFYDGTGSRLTSTLTSPSGVSSFSGTFSGVIGLWEGFSDSTPLWGLYPYRSDATADNSSVTTTLPSEQTGRAGSFAKGTNIGLAKSKSLAMGFYNVCGGVRFSVTRDDVTDVVFEALNEESVAGKVKLAFEGGVPAVQEVVEGVSSITLTAPSGGVFETGKWYYIVAIPGTLSGGFKMTFNTETKYAVLKSTDSRTIKRGKFGSLADADEDLVYKDKGTPEPGEDNIVFEDAAAKYACVAKYDTDGDGEVSYDEAEAATSFSGLFTDWKTVESFDEIKYFKNVHSLSGVFNGCSKLASLTVPDNITDLGTYAFSGCTALASVVLPEEITSIGSYTFQSCSSLSSIGIPTKVTSIDQYAFSGCTSLSSVDLAANITSIGSRAFQNCTSLASVDLPSKLATLGSYAFYGCSSLKQIAIPDGVTSLGSYAFSGCSSLKQISIPDGVTSLGSYAFNGCTSLTTASIPSGISAIPYYCFNGCRSLASVSIPSGITSIGEKAFYGVNMWKLELPASVSSMGNNCFYGIICVIVPSTTPVTIQSNTFDGVYRIFVSSGMIDMYKAMTYWSDYSDKLYPLSSYKEKSEFTLVTSGAADMGTSVKWGAYNVGASKPEEYGKYFAWGDVTGQTRNGSSWSGGGFYSNPSYEVDENGNLKTKYDAAHVNWGDTWRMPTHTEQQELIDKCGWEWTTLNDVSGRMVYSFGTGNKIFLPAAGFGYYGDLLNAGSNGYYWSSTFYGDFYAWGLYFGSDRVGTGNICRFHGLSVRPVTE